MRPPRPRLVIHIGQHKTGSKALQSFLAHNRRALAGHGVFYPVDDAPAHDVRAYAVSHFRLYALVRREALASCFGPDAAADYARATDRYCQPFESARAFFVRMEAGRRNAGADQVVLSAEDLFDMQTAHDLPYSQELVDAGAANLAGLASEFGYEPTVFVYLRRQDHLLAAHYAQYIKGSPVHDIDFDDFSREFAPRLDTHRVLERWTGVFGADRVRVRVYEPQALPLGIVPDFFDEALDLPVTAGCEPPPADVESVNRTIDRDFVEYIRVLNRRASAGLPVFGRDAVLEAALRPDTPPGPTGIAAWLSPADRRALLDSHGGGNAIIARTFLGRGHGRLFDEPHPPDDPAWQPYPGLSPDRATAISLAIHESLTTRVNPPSADGPYPRPSAGRPVRDVMTRLFGSRG